MVALKKPAKISPETFQKKSVGVAFSEITRNNLRLEASSYNIEGRKAFAVLQSCSYELVPLLDAKNGICQSAYNAFRFKRVFVDEEHGIPFLSSAEIINLYSKPETFLSKTQTKKIDKLINKKWEILVSCSGTIGNINLVSPRMEGWALSQHIIRISAPTQDTAGYVAAFLRCPYGQSQLQSLTYGSVVQHIEPEHLSNVFIPDLPPILKIHIGHSFVEAALKRDEANNFLDQATMLLEKILGMPPLPKTPKGALISKTRFSDWQGRLDASYHALCTKMALTTLQEKSFPISRLDDPLLSKKIWAVTKFRKRVYVQHGGIPMLSSKQIFQIAPVDIKRLALGAHIEDMKEIGLKENLVLVTRSGTNGKVQIIPEYMNGWAGSEHANRIEATSKEMAGFIYTWLNSSYGQVLLKRYQYGSVITHIDKDMLSSVPVPILSIEDMEKIGSMVLKANTLRNEAWQLEQNALDCLNGEIGGNK